MTNDICPTCGGTQAEIRERVWLMLRRRFPLCSGSDLLDAVMDELEPELSVLTVTPERLAALEREPNRVLRESLVLARKKLFSVSEGAIPTGIDRALKQIDRALAWSYSND